MYNFEIGKEEEEGQHFEVKGKSCIENGMLEVKDVSVPLTAKGHLSRH